MQQAQGPHGQRNLGDRAITHARGPCRQGKDRGQTLALFQGQSQDLVNVA